MALPVVVAVSAVPPAEDVAVSVVPPVVVLLVDVAVSAVVVVLPVAVAVTKSFHSWNGILDSCFTLQLYEREL